MGNPTHRKPLQIKVLTISGNLRHRNTQRFDQWRFRTAIALFEFVFPIVTQTTACKVKYGRRAKPLPFKNLLAPSITCGVWKLADKEYCISYKYLVCGSFVSFRGAMSKETKLSRLAITIEKIKQGHQIPDIEINLKPAKVHRWLKPMNFMNYGRSKYNLRL